MSDMAPETPTPAATPAPAPALAVRGLELRRAVARPGGPNGAQSPASPPPVSPPLVGPVDLTVERGQVVCLVGPSGCGKSLTCMALLDMLPDGVVRAAGSIRVNGQAVDGAPPERLRLLRGREAAYVLQNPASCFDPVFTIGAHFEETLAAHPSVVSANGTRPDWRAAALSALGEVGFADADAILRRPGPGAGRFPAHRRRAHHRPRPALAGPRAGPAGSPAAHAPHGHPAGDPRPQRGGPHGRPHGRHAPWPGGGTGRRARLVRRAAPPVHPRPAPSAAPHASASADTSGGRP